MNLTVDVFGQYVQNVCVTTVDSQLS